jgi:16S rRNA (cytosine967-C5)-methyltransferase
MRPRPQGVTRARRVAAQVLLRVRGGELADRALNEEAVGLEPRDRAWTQELAYGTLRLQGRLDHLLGHLLKGGVQAVEPDVLDVLRLGAYQLREMGSVPSYAAVSQSQELVRAIGVGRAAGFVGGVLHALARGGDDVEFPAFDVDPLGYLTTWGSHPRWLVERWFARWGAEPTRALVEANNRRPELYLRPVGITADSAVQRLVEVGVTAEQVSFSPDSVHIAPPTTAAEALGVVPAVVQDPAASLVVRYAAPEGGVVLDLCAAPGGKSLGLTDGARYVAAADVSFARLERVRENAERLDRGAHLGLVAADARQPPFRAADLVLLDVPCTGTGTLRRHPDARWRVQPRHIEELARLQAEMLEAAVACVAPGGLLVYATCSLEPEENRAQVEAFLARHPEFTVEPKGGTVADWLLEGGMLEVLPQRLEVDGSFAARLRRAA